MCVCVWLCVCVSAFTGQLWLEFVQKWTHAPAPGIFPHQSTSRFQPDFSMESPPFYVVMQTNLFSSLIGGIDQVTRLYHAI